MGLGSLINNDIGNVLGFLQNRSAAQQRKQETDQAMTFRVDQAEKDRYLAEQKLDADAAERQVRLAEYMDKQIDRIDAARPDLLKNINQVAESLAAAQIVADGPSPGPGAVDTVRRYQTLYDSLTGVAAGQNAKLDAMSKALLHLSIAGVGGGGGEESGGGASEGGPRPSGQTQPQTTSEDFSGPTTQEAEGGQRPGVEQAWPSMGEMAPESAADRWRQELATVGFPANGIEQDGNLVYTFYDQDTAKQFQDRLKFVEDRRKAKAPVIIQDKSEELRSAVGFHLQYWDKMNRSTAAVGRFEVMKATPADTAKMLEFANYAKSQGNSEEAKMWEAVAGAPEEARLGLIKKAQAAMQGQADDAQKFRDLYAPAAKAYPQQALGINPQTPARSGAGAAKMSKEEFGAKWVTDHSLKPPFTKEQKKAAEDAWNAYSAE